MAWLIDTCVLSESTRKLPDPQVAAFVDKLDFAETYISVISIGEIWKGINKLPRSRRRTFLEEWLKRELLPMFKNSPLQVDLDVMWKWGELRASLDSSGNAMPALDCLLAATALVHGLTLITRNEKDFAFAGVDVVNTWK